MDDKKDRKESTDNRFEELTDEQLEAVTGGAEVIVIGPDGKPVDVFTPDAPSDSGFKAL